MPDLSVNMVYLDPPFYSQRVQRLSDASGKKYEFSDKWKSLEDYLKYMYARIKEMHRVLVSSGSIFLHCDTSASHNLRVLLDEIFGADNFQSEIIWTYKRWSNSHKGLLPAHQTILYYTKSKSYCFNTIYGEYSPTTNVDQILQERERGENGKSIYKKDSNGEIIASKEKKASPYQMFGIFHF